LIGASRLDLHDQGLIPGQVYRLIGNNDPSVIMCIESDHGLPPCSMFQYLMPDLGTAFRARVMFPTWKPARRNSVIEWSLARQESGRRQRIGGGSGGQVWQSWEAAGGRPGAIDGGGRRDNLLAEERGWKVIVGVEPDQVEDLSDLRKLMRSEEKPDAKPRLPPKISGNDYCPCRSGKKLKNCCGAASASSGA
jgi:hypothetical protein